MRRRYSRSLRTSRGTEDVNPMEGIANMADVMLILAVGIMVALISHWNIDVSTKEKLVNIDEAEEIKNMEVLTNDDVQVVRDGGGLEEKGVVYLDPKTNKYYMKIEGK